MTRIETWAPKKSPAETRLGNGPSLPNLGLAEGTRDRGRDALRIPGYQFFLPDFHHLAQLHHVRLRLARLGEEAPALLLLLHVVLDDLLQHGDLGVEEAI